MTDEEGHTRLLFALTGLLSDIRKERTLSMAKDFTAPNNPALAFISTDEEEKPKAKTSRSKAKGKTQRRVTDAEELRTRRVQAVLTPTLYEQLSDTAWKNRQSVNETIVQAIEEYIRRHK